MHGVTITELIDKLKLQNTTPDIDTDKIVLTHPDVNRMPHHPHPAGPESGHHR